MYKMPHYLLSLLTVMVVAIYQISCNNHQTRVKTSAHPDLKKPDSASIKKKLLIVNGDSLQIAINEHFIIVPKNKIHNYDSVYAGIYRIHNNSINKVFSIQLNDIVYFTTYDNVGMGYRGNLYAFDIKKKRLLTDDSTNDNYVYSSGGIFFLNKKYIFSADKPNHEEAEDPFKTLVEVYKIKGHKFHYMKYIVTNGEMIYDDTSIIKLYNKVIKYQ